jgi:hypothetical protein
MKAWVAASLATWRPPTTTPSSRSGSKARYGTETVGNFRDGDGETPTSSRWRTPAFGLDGTDYEIDLSAEHAKELHTALGKYIDHARKAGGTSRRAPRSRAASAIDTTAVRPWAREQGIDIKDRGRVPPTSSPNTRRPPGDKHPPA